MEHSTLKIEKKLGTTGLNWNLLHLIQEKCGISKNVNFKWSNVVQKYSKVLIIWYCKQGYLENSKLNTWSSSDIVRGRDTVWVGFDGEKSIEESLFDNTT